MVPFSQGAKENWDGRGVGVITCWILSCRAKFLFSSYDENLMKTWAEQTGSGMRSVSMILNE